MQDSEDDFGTCDGCSKELTSEDCNIAWSPWASFDRVCDPCRNHVEQHGELPDHEVEQQSMGEFSA